MTDINLNIKLENINVRFESMFNRYFFARDLRIMAVIDATTKNQRKYKKFVRRVQTSFTEKTTMSDIWRMAIECEITCDYKVHS